MRVAANLATMFANVPLLQRYEKAARMGFKLVEVPFPYSTDVDDLIKSAEKFDLKHVLINAPSGIFFFYQKIFLGNWDAGDRGLAASVLARDRFRESLDVAIKYAEKLEVKKIHVMAGIVKQFERSTYDMYVENIKFAAEKFNQVGIECLVEPINPYTMSGYFLSTEQLLQEVNMPNLKILFDVFHIQQIHGQLTSAIKEHAEKIGHIQVAQVPKRTEPDSEGEINYAYIFKVLKETNPNWIIGCEYVNSGESPELVEWVKRYGLEF